MRRETGARGLASILTRHLEDAAFEAFADHPGGDVRLDVDGGELQRQSRLSDRARDPQSCVSAGGAPSSATSAKTAAGPTVPRSQNGA